MPPAAMGDWLTDHGLNHDLGEGMGADAGGDGAVIAALEEEQEVDRAILSTAALESGAGHF